MPPTRSTTSFEFADVVLVPFPFTDQRAIKKRPAAVVSSRAYNSACPDVMVLAITSQSKPARQFHEARIEHWRTAGLLKPSVLKPLVATIERKLVLRRLGKLASSDRTALVDLLHLIIAT